MFSVFSVYAAWLRSNTPAPCGPVSVRTRNIANQTRWTRDLTIGRKHLNSLFFLDHYSCFLISVQVRFCASVRSVNPQSHHITLHIFRPRVRYGRAWPLCFLSLVAFLKHFQIFAVGHHHWQCFSYFIPPWKINVNLLFYAFPYSRMLVARLRPLMSAEATLVPLTQERWWPILSFCRKSISFLANIIFL